MGCFYGLHRKYCTAFAITAFYVVMQLFLLLCCGGPSSASLQDRGSIHVMEAVKNLSSTSPVQRAIEKARLLSFSIKTLAVSRALSEAFSEGLSLTARRASSWLLWELFVGDEQESHPSSDMVARK